MVSRYVIYFFLMSAVGYVYECIAMVLWSGKWDNRGFLFGPIIPIYGAGALGGTLLFSYVIPAYQPLMVFVISMVTSAILEYIVHYTMEKLFNAYWWDYSKAPFNINGRICLPASIGFGLAGLIIVYLINPHVMPLIMKLDPVATEVLALILCMLFTADLTVTLTVVSGFKERIEELDELINQRMDKVVGAVTDESKGIDSHFYNAVDRIAQEREKLFPKGGIRRFLRGRVLYKIRGFTGRRAAGLNYVLGKIKGRIGKIRKK